MRKRLSLCRALSRFLEKAFKTSINLKYKWKRAVRTVFSQNIRTVFCQNIGTAFRQNIGTVSVKISELFSVKTDRVHCKNFFGNCLNALFLKPYLWKQPFLVAVSWKCRLVRQNNSYHESWLKLNYIFVCAKKWILYVKILGRVWVVRRNYMSIYENKRFVYVKILGRAWAVGQNYMSIDAKQRKIHVKPLKKNE